MFSIDSILSEARFQVLQGDWAYLLEKTGQCSPVLAHEWFRCCLAGYAQRKDICILLVRDGSELIGIAPLWRHRDAVRKVRIRRIGFITTPDTPFVDFIIQKERREEAIKSILHYLYTEKKDTWDVLWLNQWPAESPNYRVLREILQEQRQKMFLGIPSMIPSIPIQGKWETFLQTRSVRFRKTHRNIINRMGRLKNVEVQCIRQDMTGTVLKDILAISEKSWKHSEGTAISSWEEARRFFTELTNLAGQRGWLLVWLVKVDGLAVAMEYDLDDGAKIYALRADFDEAYREYSPGAYLQYQIVKRLFEEGYLEYGMGPGLNAYKLPWTEQMRENVTLYICNNNIKGRMVWAQEKSVQFLKWIKSFKTQISSKL